MCLRIALFSAVGSVPDAPLYKRPAVSRMSQLPKCIPFFGEPPANTMFGLSTVAICDRAKSSTLDLLSYLVVESTLRFHYAFSPLAHMFMVSSV